MYLLQHDRAQQRRQIIQILQQYTSYNASLSSCQPCYNIKYYLTGLAFQIHAESTETIASQGFMSALSWAEQFVNFRLSSKEHLQRENKLLAECTTLQYMRKCNGRLLTMFFKRNHIVMPSSLHVDPCLSIYIYKC